jgi:sigma-70-like protein
MADLKTIIQITQDQLKKQVPTHQAVLNALDSLRSREAEVVSRRAGLRDGKVETLQHIGADFKVTRERVRQIESQGLQKFRTELKKKPLADILRLALGLIRDRGGAVSTERLAAEFLPESQQTASGQNALAFLLEQSGEVVTVHESKELRAHYGLTKGHVEAAKATVAALTDILKQNRTSLTPTRLLDAIAKRNGANDQSRLITEPLIESVLEIGLAFVPADDRQWGLATWPDINPKNIREKTLYVLRKVGNPLHFKELTEKIKQSHFDKKPVTTQAVHNELINGDEFVLIGRGIYALGEWGYLPGTVSEVITGVLKKAGRPMEREAIVEAVLKQRHVSRNTILINLQEKSKFARHGKARYELAGPDPKGEPKPDKE